MSCTITSQKEEAVLKPLWRLLAQVADPDTPCISSETASTVRLPFSASHWFALSLSDELATRLARLLSDGQTPPHAQTVFPPGGIPVLRQRAVAVRGFSEDEF